MYARIPTRATVGCKKVGAYMVEYEEIRSKAGGKIVVYAGLFAA